MKETKINSYSIALTSSFTSFFHLLKVYFKHLDLVKIVFHALSNFKSVFNRYGLSDSKFG